MKLANTRATLLVLTMLALTSCGETSTNDIGTLFTPITTTENSANSRPSTESQSTSDVQQANDVQSTPEVQQTPDVQSTPEAQQTTDAQPTPEAQQTTDGPSTTEVQQTTDMQSTPDVQPTQNVPPTLEVETKPNVQPTLDAQPTPEAQPTLDDATFPYSGKFVVDEYSPSEDSPEYEGIVEIVPTPLSKTVILNGSMPRSYPDGRTTYREMCGQDVSRIALADRNGTSTPITPCSSEIPNDGASPTDFGQSNLSPDGTMVAVETRSYIYYDYSYSTMVFDIATQTVLVKATGGYNGTWTPDGRLLLASDDGLYLLDAYFENPQHIGDTITGPVGNPDVNPSGTRIVFEYNQQIWCIKIDGSDAKEILTDGNQLRFPVWNPDGSASISYLVVTSDDKYLAYIYTANFENGQTYALNLAPVLEDSSSYSLRTINGPLSWNQW